MERIGSTAKIKGTFFISSTHYFRMLPQWVIDFNNEGRAEELCNEGWDRLLKVLTANALLTTTHSKGLLEEK